MYELMYIPMRGLNLSPWRRGDDPEAIKAEFEAHLGSKIAWIGNGRWLDGYRLDDVDHRFLEARLVEVYEDPVRAENERLRKIARQMFGILYLRDMWSAKVPLDGDPIDVYNAWQIEFGEVPTPPHQRPTSLP